MRSSGLPFQKLMAVMAVMMKSAAGQGIVLSRADAFNQAGGYRSRGKGLGFRYANTNGSSKVRRAATKRRNVQRHRAACRA